MKLEDIAKTVIKDLEALEKEKRALGENLANSSGEIFDDDDLEIYSDIVLPDKKKSDLIAFNFHFDSLNFSPKREDEEKIQKNDSLSAEISDLANEKYDFADEKTDENLQNVNLENETSSQSDENLEDKNEFVNLEFENQNLEFQSEDLQTTTQNLQTQNGQIEEFKKELNDILLKFKNYKEDETEFLKALKERVVVLFEGLNAFEGDLEARVELSIKFMEFLLASIDNRVENLSK